MGKAEANFREAFERLTTNCPKVLPRGARVSQNNVAREAGVSPTALRKERYPDLCKQIYAWELANRKDQETAGEDLAVGKKKRRRSPQQINKDMKRQRDAALSRLVLAETSIVNMLNEIEQLKARMKDAGLLADVIPLGRVYVPRGRAK